MLKFFIPRQMAAYQPYIRPEAAGDIIMAAEEGGVLKAVCGFYYTGSEAVIHQLTYIEDEDLPVLDGLFRTVMFHLMEMDCKAVTIMHLSDMLSLYFEKLGFEKTADGWYSDHFPELLFSGCPGCGGQA